MRPRKAAYGTKNICGANIERLRKTMGLKQSILGAPMEELVAQYEDP